MPSLLFHGKPPRPLCCGRRRRQPARKWARLCRRGDAIPPVPPPPTRHVQPLCNRSTRRPACESSRPYPAAENAARPSAASRSKAVRRKISKNSCRCESRGRPPRAERPSTRREAAASRGAAQTRLRVAPELGFFTFRTAAAYNGCVLGRVGHFRNDMLQANSRRQCLWPVMITLVSCNQASAFSLTFKNRAGRARKEHTSRKSTKFISAHTTCILLYIYTVRDKTPMPGAESVIGSKLQNNSPHTRFGSRFERCRCRERAPCLTNTRFPTNTYTNTCPRNTDCRFGRKRCHYRQHRQPSYLLQQFAYYSLPCVDSRRSSGNLSFTFRPFFHSNSELFLAFTVRCRALALPWAGDR